MINQFQHVNNNLPKLFFFMNHTFATGLKLKNSFTNQLEQFVPMNGRNIRWYTCGPTVYSHSHMGHARNYVCNDMIRKVMKKHFGYNIQYGMNITDVEDKIIKNSQLEGTDYLKFAQKWEADFFQDMQNLGVQEPDYVTRVSQYIPEIIKFIEVIIENGYAYESNHSVYFSIENYKKKFEYGKLKRIKTAETEEEQENQKGQKRSKEDFVLWKAAKPNQPKWESKWGQGRPGWHIQCSAMAYSILGKKMDIHSGGIDLIFPHHENQITQSEAFNNEPEWVKYFIHVGHLHIKGLKMSKSLKNFTTIKQLLKYVPARVIKLFFFMHKYDVVLDYDGKQSFKEVETKDKRYKNFMSTLKARIRQQKISKPQKHTEVDSKLDNYLEETVQEIHQALCDNINTPKVLRAIDNAIKQINIYLQGQQIKLPLLIKSYKTILTAFDEMGLDYSSSQASGSKEEEIMDSIVKFRDNIRENAKSDFKTILQICDKFRDGEMVDVGVRLEDRQIGQPSIWKFESKQILIRQREEKIAVKAKKEKEKKDKEQEKLNKMKVDPKEMFLKEERYVKFDESGIPTHEKGKQGEKQINEKLKNKLIKEWKTQKQLHEKYLQMEVQENKQ